MTYSFQKLASGFALVSCLILAAFPASAAEVAAVKAPEKVVEEVAAELFAVAKANPGEKASSEAYFTQIEKILEGVVDFPYIAYVVMGENGKKATAEQKKKFAEVFKSGLVRSYAKGIANYADSEIKILPLAAAPVNPDSKKPVSVTVKQEVKDQGNVHQLAYTMRLNKKTGDWKLVNVVLNGVNLGRSFQSQFTQAIQKQGGDIDKVINSWLAEA